MNTTQIRMHSPDGFNPVMFHRTPVQFGCRNIWRSSAGDIAYGGKGEADPELVRPVGHITIPAGHHPTSEFTCISGSWPNQGEQEIFATEAQAWKDAMDAPLTAPAEGYIRATGDTARQLITAFRQHWYDCSTVEFGGLS